MCWAGTYDMSYDSTVAGTGNRQQLCCMLGRSVIGGWWLGSQSADNRHMINVGLSALHREPRRSAMNLCSGDFFNRKGEIIKVF